MCMFSFFLFDNLYVCVNVIGCILTVYFVEINVSSSLHANPFHKSSVASSATHDESLADSGVLAITRVKLFVLGDDIVRTLPQSRRDLSRLSHAERQNQKNNSFFYRLAPAAPSAFFALLHPRYFQHRFGQKKLLKTPCLPSVFFFYVVHAFFLGFWLSADPIRKWSRANPAFVFGCICSARRDSSGRVSFPPETHAVSFFVLAVN